MNEWLGIPDAALAISEKMADGVHVFYCITNNGFKVSSDAEAEPEDKYVGFYKGAMSHYAIAEDLIHAKNEMRENG